MNVPKNVIDEGRQVALDHHSETLHTIVDAVTRAAYKMGYDDGHLDGFDVGRLDGKEAAVVANTKRTRKPPGATA